MLTNYLVTAIILLALYLASEIFNHYIDRQPTANRLISGIVAGWVVLGVTYTSLAIFFLFGWWLTVTDMYPLWLLLSVSFPCWIVSGVPMIRGEYRRMNIRKEAETAIKKIRTLEAEDE